MDKEMLFKIIDQRLFLPLFLIIVVYITASYVNMRLGFEILGAKVGNKVWTSVLIMAFYTLYAQNIIPLSYSGILMMPLVAFLLKVTAKKVSIIEAAWATILVFISIAIGFIFIITPLCLNGNIKNFFTSSLYEGNITATLIEAIFPLMVLYTLPKIKPYITLIPFLKERIRGIHIIVVITYIAMFSVFYSAMYAFWVSVTTNPRHILWNLIYQWITAIIIIFGHYTITRSLRKRHESQQRMNEERISKLEQQNRELGRLNELLTARTMEQKGIIEEFKDIKGSISQWMNNNNMMIDQIKSGASTEDDVKSANPDKLSESEVTLIRLIARNKSTPEIMAEMHLSDSSVRKYISELYGKLGLKNNRVNLALYAVKYNIISRDEIEL